MMTCIGVHASHMEYLHLLWTEREVGDGGPRENEKGGGDRNQAKKMQGVGEDERTY